MQAPIPIGLAAGLCSALLFAAGAGGPVLTAMLLFMLAPLPSFLAGLGWGPRALVASGLAGMAASALVQGPNLAIVYLAAIALPVPLLCWLAHLRRPVAVPSQGGAQTGSAAPPALEWYPPGHLLAWIALIAGVLSLFSLLSIGSDVETITKTAQALVQRQSKAWAALGGKELSATEMDQIARFFVWVLPGATAMSWMFIISVNLWLAGRILRASGRLTRSWPLLPALHLPPLLALGVAVSLVLSFGSGMLALAASGFASAFVTAYAVLGLAVIHWITFGKANRVFVLTVAYVAAFMLAPYGTLPIALLGVLEPLLRLRSRTPGPPPRPDVPPTLSG